MQSQVEFTPHWQSWSCRIRCNQPYYCTGSHSGCLKTQWYY